MKQVIKKLRQLPTYGNIEKQIGDMVSYEEIVGKVSYSPGALVRIDAARALGIFPEHIESKLKLNPDDPVARGEVLAENSEFFYKRTIKSPIDGYMALWSKHLGALYIREPILAAPSEPITFNSDELGMSKVSFTERMLVGVGQIVNRGQHLLRGGKAVAPFLSKVESISAADGSLTIRPIFQPTDITAFISGMVCEVNDNDSCVVAYWGHSFIGEAGYGGEATGQIRIIDTGEPLMQAEVIPDDVGGCIVITKGGISEAALHRLKELRVSALVLGYADPVVLSRFLPSCPVQNLGILMNTPFPIILMKGYSGEIPDRVFSEMRTLDGKQAAVDASTQLRAGVRRPELFVSLPEEEFNLVDYALTVTVSGMKLGARVALKRAPYQGTEGNISAVYSEREATEAGTRATLVSVKLDNGMEIKVPLVNCQVL
jgi:hypothetical protein